MKTRNKSHTETNENKIQQIYDKKYKISCTMLLSTINSVS